MAIAKRWVTLRKDVTNFKNDEKEKHMVDVDNVIIAENKSDDLLLMSMTKRSIFTSDWILDSRCSYHMYPNRDRFFTYNSI